MAAQEVQHFSSLAVKQAAQNCAQRQQTLGEGISGVVETLAEVAQVLSQASEEDKVGELRQAVLNLLNTRNEVILHTQALGELQQSYEMSGAATDFQRLLAARTQELAAEQPYDPMRDELYCAFQDATGAGVEEEEQIDDDIAIEGGANQLAPNERCPISGKPLLALDEPVVDSRGFVYEKAAIQAWFGGAREVDCPVAGTRLRITMAELRPAKRVEKAQRRARRAGGAPHTQAEEDALDVE